MSETKKQDNNLQQAYSLALSSIAGQVGLLTLGIIFAALFAGLWLDGQMNTKPMFTIILLIASVPLTVFLMFRVVRVATAKLNTDSEDNKFKEDLNSE